MKIAPQARLIASIPPESGTRDGHSVAPSKLNLQAARRRETELTALRSQ